MPFVSSVFKAQHIENGYGTLRASASNLVCKNLHLPFYLKKKTTKQNKKKLKHPIEILSKPGMLCLT